MGWVTLTLRKLTLRAEISSLELRDIQMSRQIRSVQRNLSYEQSVFNNNKKQELSAAKADYLEIRDNRPEVGSDEYNEWQLEYSAAREDYEAQKQDINDYYDDIMNELEEAATDEETRLQEEQTTLEAQLEAMRSELETVSEQISSDIDSSKLNLK